MSEFFSRILLRTNRNIRFPKYTLIFQSNNLVKIRGILPQELKSRVKKVIAKVGKRTVYSSENYGKYFFFEFNTGIGIKLVKVIAETDSKEFTISFLIYLIFKKGNKLPIIKNESDYSIWYKSLDKYQNYNFIKSQINPEDNRVTFSFIIYYVDSKSNFLKNCINSISNQCEKNCEIIICTDKNYEGIKHISEKAEILENNSDNKSFLLNKASKKANGKILVFISPESILAEDALNFFNFFYNDFPYKSLFYTDEDELDHFKRRKKPVFKTSFDPIRIINHNFIGNNFFISKEFLIKNHGFLAEKGTDPYHELFFRLSEESNENHFFHIPRVLFHNYFNVLTSYKTSEESNLFQALDTNRWKKSVSGNNVYIKPDISGSKPMVSIIMPSACKLEFITPCIDSIIDKTSYANYEIIIVCNSIRLEDEKQRHYLDKIKLHPKINLITYDDSGFNFSKVVNIGVKEARGEFLCLLIDDIEVLTTSWIEEMICWFKVEGVGAVGAKLLYPDKSIQHAGITLGLNGLCDHLEKNSQKGSINFNLRISFPRSFSAVTGACLMTTRKTFDQVNGFDECFAEAFNDVDYCLRLKTVGLKIVFSPFSKFFHHESVSVGKNFSKERVHTFRKEINLLANRYDSIFYNDPFYSPNHSNVRPYFNFAFPPRIASPSIGDKSYAREKTLFKNLELGGVSYSPEKVTVYSHYDIHNHIDEYVLVMLTDLFQQGWKIIFVTSCPTFESSEKNKIKPLVTVIINSNGEGRDWGNFALGLRFANKNAFPESLLLCNDSLYGPFESLRGLFEKADSLDVDFVGLTDSFQNGYHLQSYFLYCKKSLCSSMAFLNYWKFFSPQPDKNLIIQENEIGFTKFFSNLGFKPHALYHYYDLHNESKNGMYGSSDLIKELDAGTLVNPSHHFGDVLISKFDFPFIKIELLRDNPAKIPGLDLAKHIIKQKNPRIFDMINSHLERVRQ